MTGIKNEIRDIFGKGCLEFFSKLAAVFCFNDHFMINKSNRHKSNPLFFCSSLYYVKYAIMDTTKNSLGVILLNLLCNRTMYIS